LKHEAQARPLTELERFNPLRSVEDIETLDERLDLRIVQRGFNPLRSVEDIETTVD